MQEQKTTISMELLEKNPMISINVRLWKSLSVILDPNCRVYMFVGPVCIMNAMQFVYLFRMWGDLTPFILNTFFAAAIFDALLRTCIVIANREHFEGLMHEFAQLYQDIEVYFLIFYLVAIDFLTASYLMFIYCVFMLFFFA